MSFSLIWRGINRLDFFNGSIKRHFGPIKAKISLVLKKPMCELFAYFLRDDFFFNESIKCVSALGVVAGPVEKV